MKTLLLLPILFCTLLIGCKTTTPSITNVVYPRNAQLQHGYYGRAMYNPGNDNKKAVCESCSPTAKADISKQIVPIAVIAVPAVITSAVISD